MPKAYLQKKSQWIGLHKNSKLLLYIRLFRGWKDKPRLGENISKTHIWQKGLYPEYIKEFSKLNTKYTSDPKIY